MTRRATGRFAALSIAAFAVACSVMNLGDVDVLPCEGNEDCADAIRAAGNDPALCVSYLCNTMSGFCEPAGGERCDGRDNDCDGFVDEGLSREPRKFDPAPQPSRKSFAYAVGPAGTTYVAHGKRGRGWVIRAGEEPGVSGHELNSDYATREGSQSGCPDNNESGHLCNFKELALAVHGERLVMASINTRGCGTGQVRFGVSSNAEPFRMFLGSLASESPLLFGVPDEVACDKGRPRASFPALAVSEGIGSTQALALWLDAAPDEPANDSAPAEVLALGLIVPSEERASLVAVNTGKPTALGESACRAAPAVLGNLQLEGAARFVVAFPETGDSPGIQLRTLGFEPSRDSSLETRQIHIPDTDPGPVALARGSTEADGSPSIALAWRVGCGSGGGIRFAKVSFPAGADAAYAAPLAIASGAIVRGPELVYAEHGFATAAPEGGWFVLWEEDLADSRRLQLARIAERELELLETRTLALGVSETWFPQSLPASDVGSIELGYGALVGSEDEAEPVVVSSVSCVVSN